MATYFVTWTERFKRVRVPAVRAAGPFDTKKKAQAFAREFRQTAALDPMPKVSVRAAETEAAALDAETAAA